MDSFIGEVRAFGFNYVPEDWAACNGQTVTIQQYQALYAVIGNTFGGSQSSNNFKLPDLQGRVVAGAAASGLTYGTAAGAESVACSAAQLPSHSHGLKAANMAPMNRANLSPTPAPNRWLSVMNNFADPVKNEPIAAESTTSTPNATLAASTIGLTGTSGPHENRQPFLAMNFCISLNGVFPVRA